MDENAVLDDLLDTVEAQQATIERLTAHVDANAERIRVLEVRAGIRPEE